MTHNLSSRIICVGPIIDFTQIYVQTWYDPDWNHNFGLEKNFAGHTYDWLNRFLTYDIGTFRDQVLVCNWINCLIRTSIFDVLPHQIPAQFFLPSPFCQWNIWNYGTIRSKLKLGLRIDQNKQAQLYSWIEAPTQKLIRSSLSGLFSHFRIDQISD